MTKTSTFLLSLLVSLSALACTAEEPVPELTKDEVRAMPIDEKADHLDFCEVFGWYDDQVCDDFCPNPDPDCVFSCEMSDCPPAPEFSPRPCEDGSFVFASATCEANEESETCGLEISAGSCPEDRICEMSDCPEPPHFQPRPCLDGTFIFGSADCNADMNGDCGLEFSAGTCPEDRVCEVSDCPPAPEFSPRPCDDGSFVFASASCEADLNGDCGLNITGGTCPEDEDSE